MTDLLLSSDADPERPPPTGEKAAAILNAALRLVAERGLDELTLRPLAEFAGVSTATVTHHLGSKAEILPRLLEHVLSQDEAFFKVWVRRAAGIPSGSSLRQDIVRRAASEWFSTAGARAVLLAELVQAPQLDEVMRRLLAQWAGVHDAGWSALSASPAIGHTITRMLIDEAAFTASLSAYPAYQHLRDLCLRRILVPYGATDSVYFRTLRDELAPEASLLDMEDRQNSKQVPIAEAAAKLIVEKGIGALTHRAVASEAGLSAAGVVYHFGSRDALLLAGLERVLYNFTDWLRAFRAHGGEDHVWNDDVIRATAGLVRSTHAIGVCADRFPTLRPHAADMRRRRGENVRPGDYQDIRYVHDGVACPLTAQVMSVAIFGTRMLTMALGQDEVTCVSDTRGHLANLL